MTGAGRLAGRLALVAVGAAVAGAIAGSMLALRVARDVVTPPRRRAFDVPIIGVDREAALVRLGRTADTEVPGRYSLRFDDDRGHARVGDIVELDERSVVRRLHGVQRGDLERASAGRWSAWWYQTPADLGVRFTEVAIDTPVGAAPAWLIDPDDRSPDDDAPAPWLIAVHGRGVTRAEALRAVPVSRAAGYRSLLISYRNDGEAPASADGRYALGGEEWRDVDAAITYALGRGATRIVLMGWSMGGAIVLQCVLSSAVADRIDGVVLESPVVDWVSVLRFQAGAVGLPPAVRDAALGLLGSSRGSALIGLESPIDFTRLDMVARAAELPVPLLVLHSDDDGFVPSDGSVALAAARPDVVRLERFTRARHTKLWNHDPERWERAIRVWLDELRPLSPPGPSGRTERPRRRPGAASAADR